MEYFIAAYTEKYADFRGRARRKEYWMFYLFYMLTIFILGIAAALVASLKNDIATGTMIVIIVLFVLASIVPSWAITARRFHDVDMSGWWQLLNLIPYVGPIIVFVFMVLPGTKGVNRFGGDPIIQEQWNKQK